MLRLVNLIDDLISKHIYFPLLLVAWLDGVCAHDLCLSRLNLLVQSKTVDLGDVMWFYLNVEVQVKIRCLRRVHDLVCVLSLQSARQM